MIRHFVSDLDGTLLNQAFEWDRVIESGVRKLLTLGHDFAAATGRTIGGAKTLRGLWELPVYLILMNGSLVLDKKREIILSREVSRETRKLCLERCRKAGLEFITKDYTLTRLGREEYIRRYSAWDMWRKKVLEKKESGYFDQYLGRILFDATEEEILQAPVLKINGLELDDTKYQQLLQELEGALKDAVNAPFADHVLEITDIEASKAKTLGWLSQKLGWKQEETAVFGDGGNDVEMLRSFPHSYAPVNAADAARQAAKEVTESCSEYGVLKKMLELADIFPDTGKKAPSVSNKSAGFL